MKNTTDGTMEFNDLEKRVFESKSSQDAMNRLIEDYIPFIRTTAVKTIPPDAYDSYSTTAMSAFAEAVHKFNNTKGSFFGFASLVITNRVKDQIRKEFKPNEISGIDFEREAAFEENADRKMEVDMYKNELAEYGISLEDLLKNSPKHKSSRIKANMAADTLAGNEILFSTLVKKGKVSVGKLSELSGIAEKLIEQKRKYIISRVLLKQEKYSYLREFVN